MDLFVSQLLTDLYPFTAVLMPRRRPMRIAFTDASVVAVPEGKLHQE